MIALLVALASRTPLPNHTVNVDISEVRVGHAVVQEPATHLPGSDSGWDPSVDGRLGVRDYGGTGILASVGMQWLKIRRGVR